MEMSLKMVQLVQILPLVQNIGGPGTLWGLIVQVCYVVAPVGILDDYSIPSPFVIPVKAFMALDQDILKITLSHINLLDL